MFRKSSHDIPGLNTASLPDLIFTVLFFFMIVSHIKTVDVKVKYEEPQGNELKELKKQSNIRYILVGTRQNAQHVEVTSIQLDDKLVNARDITRLIKERRQEMTSEQRASHIVSLSADKETPMSVINDIKMSLRRAGALKINYAAREQEKKLTKSQSPRMTH